MGGGTDADLSYGVVAAISRTGKWVLRPVLQVVSPPQRSVAAERYRVMLSDGINALPGLIAHSLDHLVTGGDLRCGTVVRVLYYYICGGKRFLIVMQLEIMQTECALIGSPTLTEDFVTLPASGDPSYPSVAQNALDSLSGFPRQVVLDSSSVPRAEHAVYNLQFGGCHGSTLPHNTVATKMQELSLDDRQNKRFPVTTAVENFGPGSSTFRNLLPPEHLLPSPMFTDRSRAAMNQGPCIVTLISALNPYKSGWTIRARVTAKTDLRHYGNTRGSGKVFSFDFIDAQGGEIRVTCFNLQADRYFDLIEVDKVYLMSGGIVRPALKNYGTLNGDYEIFADNLTSIQVCSDDDSSIPRQRYNFIQISEIEGMEHGSLVDLLAVVTSVSPSATLRRKDGTGIQKRTLRLKDMSDRSVEITFWGELCDREGQKLQCLFESGSCPVLAIKGCRVVDFIRRSLDTISSTQLKVNPDIPETERLRQWYLTDGKSADQEMLSVNSNPIITPIALLKDVKLGQSGKTNWITVRAKILKVNCFCYPACTLFFNGEQCKAKVTRNSDGTWNCNRCAVDFTKCEYRYVMTCQLQDPTGVTYATAINKAGMEIIGCSAEEILILKGQDEAKWEDIMLGVCQQEYLFKLSVKENLVTSNGETHVKCYIVSAEKLDA